MNNRLVINAPEYKGHSIAYNGEAWVAQLPDNTTVVARAEQLPELHAKIDKLVKKAEAFARVDLIKLGTEDRYEREGSRRALERWTAVSRNGFEVRFQKKGARDWTQTRYVDAWALDTPENRVLAEQALDLYAKAADLFREAQAVEKSMKRYALTDEDREVVK